MRQLHRRGWYIIDPYLTHKHSQSVVILTAIRVRFCSWKAALHMRIPHLSIRHLVGSLWTVAISVGSPGRVSVCVSVVIW